MYNEPLRKRSIVGTLSGGAAREYTGYRLFVAVRVFDYPFTKPDGAVNGGHSPFILNADCSGWGYKLFIFQILDNVDKLTFQP